MLCGKIPISDSEMQRQWYLIKLLISWKRYFSFLQTLDNGMRVIQLETAVGAAMKNFDGAHGTINTCP